MPAQFFNPKTNLAFAKLVATPTELAWSQAYNAGNLFIAVSFEKHADDEIQLQVAGKELFNNLEAEFFTLEQKNLKSIKHALAKSLESLSPSITISIALAYVSADILYVFIYGSGKIIMKRDEKIGILLEKNGTGDSILSASGYLLNNDCVILQTSKFAQSISPQVLTSALDLVLPNDIAEALSPHIHETDNGSEAAVVITYHGSQAPHKEIAAEEEYFPNPEPEEINNSSIEPAMHSSQVPYKEPGTKTSMLSRLKFKKPSIRIPAGVRLTHTNKLFLSITVIIVVLLVSSIYLYKKSQNTQKQQQLFSQIYPPAKQDYADGKALEGLNNIKAHAFFLKAQELLQSSQAEFAPGSLQGQQITSLLSDIQQEETKTGNIHLITSSRASLPSEDMLSIEKNTPSAITFAQDDANVYYITQTGVIKIDKSTGNKNTIITNNSSWTDPAAIAAYEGNIYILDKTRGVIKYTAGSNGFGKSSYFKNQSPDLSKAVGMAIDGSVWILFSNGSVLEFTSAKADNYQITGLDQPLSNPTKIFTNLTTNSLYILDNGNGRVVQLGKDGKYQEAYASSPIPQAKDFEVIEPKKQLFILQASSIWQLPLQ